MHFIGIDIGTTSICGVVYDFFSGRAESINKKNDFVLSSRNAWESLQDPEQIILCVNRIITELKDKYPNVKGIGITGQMHGIVYVNEEGNAVSPLYTWQDGRGNLSFQDGKTYVEFLSANCGYCLSSGYGLVTHFYNMRKGIVAKNAVKLCTIMDYAVMRLTGRRAPLTDFSNAASLGFFNVRNNQFDIETLIGFGIGQAILPDIGQSGLPAGFYNGIPVFSALGDNQASFIGSVKNREKSMHITIGTSSQLSIYSESYLKVDTIEVRPFPWGGYLLVGAALSGGQSLSLLKSFFQKTLRLFSCNSLTEDDLYNIMFSIGTTKRDGEQLEVKTLFNGARSNPAIRGNISNISFSNLTPENLIIGFLRGICEELYEFYKVIPDDAKRKKDLLVGSGNAIEKNDLLCEVLEETFGLNLVRTKYNEDAAFGACISAMKGGDYIDNYADIHKQNNLTIIRR